MKDIEKPLIDPIKKLESAKLNRNTCINTDAETPGQLKELEEEFIAWCQERLPAQVFTSCKSDFWSNFGSVYYCEFQGFGAHPKTWCAPGLAPGSAPSTSTSTSPGEFEGMEIVNSTTFVSEFHVPHPENKTNSYVNGISIKNSPELFFFPKRFDQIFSGIKGIDISDTGLSIITQDDPLVFPELTALWLFANKLTSVEPELFISNPKLRHFDFSNNRIRSFAADLFGSIPQLETVWFNHNVCIGIDAKIPGEIKALEKKILEKCQN